MALAIDGTPVITTGSGNTTTFPGFTTSNANDVIIVYALTNDGGTITCTSTSLTFTQRAQVFIANNYLTEFYAIAASALTSEVITIHCSTNASFTSACAFGVSGANTSSPFDSNVSLPATGTTSPLTISTTSANTMVIGGFRQNTVTSPTAGAGYTLISGANFGCYEYQIFTSAQTSLSVNDSNDADVNGSIADAIVAASSPAPWAALTGGGGQHAMIRQIRVVGY